MLSIGLNVPDRFLTKFCVFCPNSFFKREQEKLHWANITESNITQKVNRFEIKISK